MSGIVYEELLAYVREQLAADRAAQDAADDADVIAGRAVYIAGGTVKPDYRLAKLIAQHEDNLEPLRKVLVEMTGDSAFAKYKPVGPRAARKDYARNKSVERKYLLACKLDRIREIIKQKTGRKKRAAAIAC